MKLQNKPEKSAFFDETEKERKIDSLPPPPPPSVRRKGYKRVASSMAEIILTWLPTSETYDQ